MTLNEILLGADDVSRRGFLSAAAKGLLGIGALPLLTGAAAAVVNEGVVPLEPATARNVIYLYLSGGMSHIDTFDTKPGAENQGPVETIRTNADGVRIAHYFPNLARHADKMALINSMHSTQGAHSTGRYYLHTGYTLRGTIEHPSLGAWLSRLSGKINGNLPAHVAIGAGAQTATGGFLESIHAPLPIGDPASGLANGERSGHVTESAFQKRLDRVRDMNQAFASSHDHKKVRAYSDMYDQAVKLMQSRDLAAFDIAEEPDWLRDTYGRDRFGQGCLLARRLIEHDVRFVEVVSGGWDTHNDNFDALEEKCPELDRALSSLLADLDARGLLEETLVVVSTEFGRTPEVTDRNGRNHYPKAFTCLLAGGGIRGGRTYGRTDATGHEVIENPVSIPDFNATIARALGLPLEYLVYSPSGRPFTVADKGRAVNELFA